MHVIWKRTSLPASNSQFTCECCFVLMILCSCCLQVNHPICLDAHNLNMLLKMPRCRIITIELVFMLSGCKPLYHLSHSQFTHVPCCVLLMQNCKLKPSNLGMCYLKVNCSTSWATDNYKLYLAMLSLMLLRRIFKPANLCSCCFRSKPLYLLSHSQFTHASYDAEMQIQTIELVFMLSGSKLLYQLSCWQFTRAL